MGWIDLKNDLIPTLGTISLPPEVSNKFSEVAHLFENYPPLLMVFEEAIQELIDAAKGNERKSPSSLSDGSATRPLMASETNLA